jgi:integrase
MKQQSKHQTGYIFRSGRFWYGRWFRDELVDCNDLTKKDRELLQQKGIPLPDHDDGTRVMVRRQHAEKLAQFGDRYRIRRDVECLLAEKLKPANEGRERGEGTMNVAAYARDFFLPYSDREFKPSTSHGHRCLFKTYLQPHLGNLILRDARCCDIVRVLEEIHKTHNKKKGGLSRKTLSHCKGLLTAIFSFAKRNGVINGELPTRDANIPRKARPSPPTVAYSCDTILQMLSALTGTARVAVAIGFFAGLRPGEMKGLKWEDYDGREIHIRRSVWRSFETLPKTPESVGSVPVETVLKEILDQHRLKASSEYILSSASGKKRVHLENLSARVIRPILDEAGIVWHGWYSLRRGAATALTSVDSALAAKTMLRHSNIQTTNAHYIKDDAEGARRAAARVDALFQNSNAVPN